MSKPVKPAVDKSTPHKLRPVGTCVLCQEEKPIVARGQCANCYMKLRRQGIDKVEKLTKAVESLENSAEEARRILVESLPNAARYLTAAAKKAAKKGDGTAARWLLQGVPVKLSDGSTRVLAEPAKPEAAQPASAQIVIGFVPGCIRQPEAAPVPAIEGTVVAQPPDQPNPQKP